MGLQKGFGVLVLSSFAILISSIIIRIILNIIKPQYIILVQKYTTYVKFNKFKINVVCGNFPK